MRLRTKFSLIVAGAMALIIVLLAVGIHALQQRHLERMLRERGTVQLQLLAQSSVAAIMDNDMIPLAPFQTQFRDDEDILFASVQGKAGKLVDVIKPQLPNLPPTSFWSSQSRLGTRRSAASSWACRSSRSTGTCGKPPC